MEFHTDLLYSIRLYQGQTKGLLTLGDFKIFN